jgi:hypothetical protein
VGIRPEQKHRSPCRIVRNNLGWSVAVGSPFDSETSDSGLLGEDIAANLLKNRLGRWIGVELLRVVLVVDVVTDTNELAVVVGTG